VVGIVASASEDMSIDSILSDLSAMRLSRPGLGDKMLDSARDYRMPLTRSQASPPGSAICERVGNKTSFDSIIDCDRPFSSDSIFDKTNQHSSASSESVFVRTIRSAPHQAPS